MTTTTINAAAATYNLVYGNDASYVTSHATSAVVSASGNIGLQLSGNYYCYRNPIKFDTSIIPDGSTILQANMKLAVTTDASDTDFDVDIAKYDWSASDPLAAGTREAIYDGILAATLDDSIWRNTSGISLNTYYTSGNLSVAWINITGSTYYGLLSSRDKAFSTPTGNELVVIDFVTNVPQLVIAYNPPAGNPVAYLSDYAVL
jgi:hypothetical protein